jgi:hypothetical protein
MSAVRHPGRIGGKTRRGARRILIVASALGFWLAGLKIIDGIVWASEKLEGRVPGVHALVLRK